MYPNGVECSNCSLLFSLAKEVAMGTFLSVVDPTLPLLQWGCSFPEGFAGICFPWNIAHCICFPDFWAVCLVLAILCKKSFKMYSHSGQKQTWVHYSINKLINCTWVYFHEFQLILDTVPWTQHCTRAAVAHVHGNPIFFPPFSFMVLSWVDTYSNLWLVFTLNFGFFFFHHGSWIEVPGDVFKTPNRWIFGIS